MKAKYNKLCSFNMDIAEKLNSEPNRKTNLVIGEAVKAHYEGRILPFGCSIDTLDITDFILNEIEKSEKVDTWLDGSRLSTSSYMIGMDNENHYYKINFMLKSADLNVDIRFNIILEESIYSVHFENMTGGSEKYKTIIDDNRLNEIEITASFKL